MERIGMLKIENVLPNDIERRSMQIIDEELAAMGIALDPAQAPVIKRCIHTSADFDYARNLAFSPHALETGLEALKAGCTIVTDTKMAYSGISKPTLAKLGCQAACFIADEDVAQRAKESGCTRSTICMDKAAEIDGDVIIAIGNAPTALIRVAELIDEGALKPKLVIGAPVGFVNVEVSKEIIMERDVEYIVARGRKGGSNIAACICNALLYLASGRSL